jgi:hypothetical protein
MSKETNIDCMKYRKSTHIAGVDVEMIIAEKGKCILTIKEAYYGKGVDVSGNKTDGYFLDFVEDVKPMVVNSGNRNEISKIVKQVKELDRVESRNIGNWSEVKIELYFDEKVKMMGQITGGIKVMPKAVIIEKPAFTSVNFEKAKAAKATVEAIKKAYTITPEVEKEYLKYYGTEK